MRRRRRKKKRRKRGREREREKINKPYQCYFSVNIPIMVVCGSVYVPSSLLLVLSNVAY